MGEIKLAVVTIIIIVKVSISAIGVRLPGALECQEQEKERGGEERGRMGGSDGGNLVLSTGGSFQTADPPTKRNE